MIINIIMSYYIKYLKYKTKYFDLKNKLSGGKKDQKLLFYRIGKKEYDFSFDKFAEIKEGTDAIFFDNDMIVITRPGEIYYISDYKNNTNHKKIKNMKEESGFTHNDTELGLLGIAKISNYIYLSYTIKNTSANGVDLVIDEYLFENLKLTKTQNIFAISFTTSYHHGGHMIVNNDKIYLGVGDGGPQGDPHNQSQNIDTFKGKIIEIDPKITHVGKIIALGLRNPWLFSFDNQQRIWIGDVGWNTSESVKLISDIKKTYNFGWSYYEGSVKTKPGKKFDDFDHPIWEYPTSDETGRSIIGGFYISKLNIYIFGDYLGFVRAIKLGIDGSWEEIGNTKLTPKELIYSLAYDHETIYILTNKNIYKLSWNEFK